jgi:mitotic spindle assembly checkpoint protein MAD2B
MPPPQKPLLLTTQSALLQTLSDFLTVAFHQILFSRSLYPTSTFLLTRAYNFPVRQNRHPKVCRWVLDSVSSIHVQMLKGNVQRIVFVVYSEDGRTTEVMERFVFDVSGWPVVEAREQWTELVRDDDEIGEEGEGEGPKLRGVGVSAVDVEEQLRATIRKLAYSCEKLEPLPEGCTYTVAVELKDSADPPIGHPQAWIPSEPSLQTGDKAESDRVGSDLGGVRSLAVRAVEAGEFRLESWIEEGRAKGNYD